MCGMETCVSAVLAWYYIWKDGAVQVRIIICLLAN